MANKQKEKSSPRRFLGIAVGSSLAALLFVRILTPDEEAPPPAVETLDESSTVDSPEREMGEEVFEPTSPAPERSTAENVQKEFEWQETWFRPPERSADGLYLADEMPVSFSRTCEGRTLPLREGESFTRYLQKTTGASPRTPWPDDVHFEQLTHFWAAEGQYYQATLAWERTDPPIYRVEFYRASAPDMNQNLQPIVLTEGASERTYDAEGAMRVIEAAYRRDTSRAGFAEGSRILETRLLNVETGKWSDIEFLNATPVSYRSDDLFCQALTNPAQMLCHCPLAPQ